MSTVTTPARAGLHELPIGVLAPWARNPRRKKAGLEDLAASIASVGIVEPLVVRPHPEMHPGFDAERYEIIAGERRFRAAKMAGLLMVPTVVRDLTDAQALELALIENNQRADVHPLEEARAFEELQKIDRAYTPEVIAAKIGRPVAYIRHRLRLLELIVKVQLAFEDDAITIGHAERLAKLSPELQERALEEGCFSPLFELETPEQRRLALQPLAKLEEWIRQHTVIDLKSPITQEELPQLAQEAAGLEADGATLVQLSTAYRPEHGLRGKKAPIPSTSWKEVKPSACKHAQQGVVVYGDTKRAEILTVCIRASKCSKHWPAPPKGEDGEPAWKAEQRQREEQWKKEREEAEAWRRRLPAVLKAFAAHLAGYALTPALIFEAIEQLGAKEETRAAIGAVDEASLGQALAFAIAIRRGHWSRGDFAKVAKRHGFDLKACEKPLLEAEKAEAAAAAPEQASAKAPKTAAKKPARKGKAKK
jgi:ParB/RepB/Spo0J family partition protein